MSEERITKHGWACESCGERTWNAPDDTGAALCDECAEALDEYDAACDEDDVERIPTITFTEEV